MNLRLRNVVVSVFSLTIPLQLAIAVRAQQTVQPETTPSAVSKVFTMIEESQKKLDELDKRLSPESATIRSANDELVKLLNDGTPDSPDKMRRAAGELQRIRDGMQAILAREKELRQVYGKQIAAIDQAWRSIGRGAGTAPAGDGRVQQAIEQRKTIIGGLLHGEDVSDDWRTIFEDTFDLLTQDEDLETAEAEAANAEVWNQSVEMLRGVREGTYKRYAEDMAQLRRVRLQLLSIEMQQKALAAAGDLMALRQRYEAIDTVRLFGGPNAIKSGTLTAVRDVVERATQGRSARPQVERTPEQRRRDIQIYAEKSRQQLAQGGK